MSKKKVEKIRKNHEYFKNTFQQKPIWRAHIAVEELDMLLAYVDKLNTKLAKLSKKPR
jgi:hypothetical protein